ncbi:MAG: Ig-like domain-containing protein [Gammaproteobacteria bacterium]|nr:Ig-like domain-containing protein [Gammaproteobacteria bacterium]
MSGTHNHRVDFRFGIEKCVLLLLGAFFSLPVFSSSSPETLDALPASLLAAVSQTWAQPSWRLVNGVAERSMNGHHSMDYRLSAQALSIKSAVGEVQMSLHSYGDGQQTIFAETPSLQVNGKRLEKQYQQLTEWYLDSPLGLEQGFTFAQPLSKQRGELILNLAFSGSLTPQLKDQTLHFLDGKQRSQLTYDKLYAFDATGRELPSRMVLAGNTLSLRVDDRDAIYPVVVDPLFSPVRLVDSRGIAGDRFGLSVAIDGSTAVVGADSVGAADTFGAAVVYEKQHGIWQEVAHLNTATSFGDRLGYSVAISGDTIVVGAWDMPNGAATQPSVYVYVKGANGWPTVETARLRPLDPQLALSGSTRFGHSVDISAGVVVVGAPSYDVTPPVGILCKGLASQGVDAGAAFVFVRPVAGWSGSQNEAVMLMDGDACDSDALGVSVAIDADTVVLGAHGDDGGVSGFVDAAGSVYVFVKPLAGWHSPTPLTESATLRAFAREGTAHFGFSVDVSNDVVVVGAFGDPNKVGVNTSSGSGAAFIFEKPLNGWMGLLTETVKLNAADRAGKDNFGHSVAISADTVVVGAPRSEEAVLAPLVAEVDSGAMYLFSKPVAGWASGAVGGVMISSVKKLAATPASGDLYGYSVAVSGNVLIAGAPSCTGIEMTAFGSVKQCALTTAVPTFIAGTGMAYLFDSVAALNVVKTDSTASGVVSRSSANKVVRLSQGVTYTLSITNSDPLVDATQVVLTDVLPANVSYQSAAVTQGTGSCVEAAGTVNCTFAQIPSNSGVASVSIVATAPASAQRISNTASIEYPEDDTNLNNNQSSVSTEANAQPLANNQGLSLFEDVTKNGFVIGNDPDGGSVTYSINQPANGTITNINATTGAFSYTPNANFVGVDTFIFSADDQHEPSVLATVTVTVENLPDPPVALDDTATTLEDTAISISYADLLLNDTDPDLGQTALLIVASHDQFSANGVAIAATAGGLVYTPALNSHGSDHFSYVVKDPDGHQDVGTVSITVTSVADAPVAVNDVMVSLNGAVIQNFSVLANDEDIEGLGLVVTSNTTPSNGQLLLNSANATFTYTPNPGFNNGQDSFTYTLSNVGISDPALSATATVYVVVSTTAPLVHISSEDTVTTVAGLNAQLLIGEVNSMTSSAQGGTVVRNANGTVSYTPPLNFFGNDTFGYLDVNNNAGSVDLTVTAVNDAPVANNMPSLIVNEDTVKIGQLAGSDVDGDAITFQAGQVSASGGSVVVNPNGTFVFTPDANFNGLGVFNFVVVDDKGASSQAVTVTVNVIPVPDPPTATEDLYSVDEDAVLIGDPNVNSQIDGLLENDVDIDNSLNPTFSVVGFDARSLKGGTVSVEANGKFSYTPAKDFNGVDRFQYTITNGLAQGTGTVTITVNPSRDANIAADVVEDIVFNGSFTTANLLASSSLAALATISVDQSSANGGTILDHGDGTFTYTPAANFAGNDSFTYTITDSVTGSKEVATISVTVAAKPVVTKSGGGALAPLMLLTLFILLMQRRRFLR